MQQKRELSQWTKIAGLLLIGGVLAWTVKLLIIIGTNGRIIDTGPAAVLMTTGLLLLAVGSTGIGFRLVVQRPLWMRIIAMILSPVFCIAFLFLLGSGIVPLFENSKIRYAQQEAPIAVAIAFFAPIGIALYRGRYVLRQHKPGAVNRNSPRKARNVLKWTGIALLLLVGSLAITTATRQHLTYEAPYPAIKASADTAVIAKGKQLVLVNKGCVHCHSPVNNIDSVMKRGLQPSLAGAKKFETPFGTFYSPNLTPDAETGIGQKSDAEIARLLRYGVKKNGEAALPFMQGLNMDDADMTAVISYLRSLQPVSSKVPENEFNLVGRFAKAFVVKPSLPPATASIATR